MPEKFVVTVAVFHEWEEEAEFEFETNNVDELKRFARAVAETSLWIKFSFWPVGFEWEGDE